MNQPPRLTSGNFPLDRAQPSVRREETVSGGFVEPSNLETMAASAVSATNLNLGSASLAVLGRRYDIVAEAGRGAMGQVYKARDRETGEIVALKLLKPEIASDPGMVERFKSELLFARRITHKNVCRVYEFNRIDGIAYTSMEFVEGESLRSVLKRFGSLTPRKGIDVALQMCSGLKEAHAQGIVHRDLKPENVMIDVQGNVKVMDFGIARSMEAMTLLTGSMVGTPAYMAPEQAAGRNVDYRADIYALGLMLYEMFTGTQPFQADNAVALAVKHLQELPRPPREIEPSISESMECAILKCLEKSPDCRFPSMAELEVALRSQLPAQAADRSTAVFPAGTSNATVGAAVATPTSVSSAPPVQKASRTGWAALVLLVGTVALGAGTFWRGRAARGNGENAVEISKVSSPAVPNVSVAVAAKSPSATTSEPAKPATPPAPQAKKFTASPHAEGNVASSGPPHRASVAAAVAPATKQVWPKEAQTAPAMVSSQDPPAAPTDPAVPSARGGGGYVWVSRFPREVGAQNAARKIEEMGLPVSIIPKHNTVTDENFFVVLTGPYAAAKIDGILERLKSRGFLQARPNKGIAGGTKPVPHLGSAAAPTP
ncbi:MAG: serine/threonine-protein kinase [Candidatus Acidiferrales bacterium]|jgi:serine/threonine protein kinase